ncbi:MAG: hypothetical protein II786_08020 [Muribaculaceae bacterium]|nr:hypothetical protein [Muribaculaceae bacterium]
MKRILIAIVLLAAILGICWWLMPNKQSVVADENAPAWYEDMDALQADLDSAIAEVQKFDTTKISHSLMPIRKDYPGQEWGTFDGHDMVLVVTLVDSSRMEKFFGRDDVYRIDREMGTWVSLPADWVNRNAAFEGLDSVAAHMRLLQLFGLSPDCDYDIMVKFYADPAGIFRPAHDPDITTTTVGMEFPSHVDDNFNVGETHFREWYRYSVEAAYEDDSPLPWTQMGYTYDWHRGANHVGLSEYIVGHHTLIKVKSRETAWQFVQNLFKPQN